MTLPFYNRITVHHDELARKTRRWLLIGTQTASMKSAISALEAYEKTPNKDTLFLLSHAMTEWKTKNPKEFANRDKKSGGLATQLLIELGSSDLRNTTTNAFIMRGSDRVTPTTRKVPTVEKLTTSLGEYAASAKPDTTGVVIIDAQIEGLEHRWDGKTTVRENMVSVLASAVSAGLPIIEVWSGDTHSDKSKTIEELQDVLASAKKNSLDLKTVRKTSNNAFERDLAIGSDGEVALNRLMSDTGCSEFIVMGYNANQCVAAFLFGNLGSPRAGTEKDLLGVPKMLPGAYVPGALDRGFDIVSSRAVLASDGNKLDTKEGWPFIGS